MRVEPDDDPVMRLADIAVSALMRVLPAIRADIVAAARKELSGDRIYIPKALSTQKASRNEAIRTDHAAGMSIRAIARKHHVSKTRAADIIKGNR